MHFLRRCSLKSSQTRSNLTASLDKSIPPLLERPLPEPTSPSDEPQAKRQKSDGSASPDAAASSKSITAKVGSDAYALLDDLVLDVATIVTSELATLETPTVPKKEADAEADAKDATGEKDEKGEEDETDAKSAESAKEDDSAKRKAVARIAKFRDMAYDLYRRETAYPKSGPLHGKTGGKINGAISPAVPSSNRGEPILTVFGTTPGPRQLFSSLPHHYAPKTKGDSGEDDEEDIEEIVREDVDVDLGSNITLTRTFAPPPPDTSGRILTFGELFPSPRNLPPLQLPKAPKSTAKMTTLGFYHPELAERSKYLTGSYSSQHLATGHWLDYSNAAPSSQIMTRQRERAQSLAGHKPSITQLEMSEMESLFRGAFSSFAPSKDDTAAIVSAAHVGCMWWQRTGHRMFQRMIESEMGEYDAEDEDIDEAMTPTDVAVGDGAGVASTAIALDEEALQKTIDEWDDTLVDPSLEDVMGQKSAAEKDVDEILQDVSDLILTLASYQQNRNLTLPTSQDRSSTDPVNVDMLRNGTLAQQPSEEEMLTYQTLKAQLSLIIQELPPYAVARLNSDRLEELNISTKIEVRSEEYHGILEEDEAVVRARQAAAQAAAAAQATTASTPTQRASTSHRAASTASATNHAFSSQFNTPTRPPAAAGAYPGQYQTPGRAASTHRSSVGSAAGAVGTPQATALPPHVRPGVPGQTTFRPNGYANYVPGSSKVPTPQPPPSQFRGQQLAMGYHMPGSPGQPVPAHMSPQQQQQRVVSQQQQPGMYGTPVPPPAGVAPQQFRYMSGMPGTPGNQQQVPLAAVPQAGMGSPQLQQARRPSQGMPYPGSPSNGLSHLAGQQRPIVPPPPQQGSPQQRFHHPVGNAGIPTTPGQPQPQHLMARPLPYGAGGPMTPLPGQPLQQQQQQQQRPLGPVGYHTVMDQPQQQRLMEQARARASAHERSLGFGDKLAQGGGLGGGGGGGGGGMGQVAGLAGIGLGGVGGGLVRPGLPQQPAPHQLQSSMPAAPSISPAPSNSGFSRPS